MSKKNEKKFPLDLPPVKEDIKIPVIDRRAGSQEQEGVTTEASGHHFTGDKIRTTIGSLADTLEEQEIMKHIADPKNWEPGPVRVAVEYRNIKHVDVGNGVVLKGMNPNGMKLCEVLAVAPSAEKMKQWKLKPGDYVLISANTGYNAESGQRQVWFVFEMDVIAVVYRKPEQETFITEI